VTVLEITPGLPAVWGPLNVVANGARYATAASFPGNAALEPYADRLAVCVHLVNSSNVGGSAESFYRNHLVPSGDKPVSPGSPRLYGTCYHVIISGDGSIVVALDETAAPNSAGNPANRRMIHVVLMIGDWSTRDARHTRTLETLAQFLATCAMGFGLPVEWLNVYHERNLALRVERSLLLTNTDRVKFGIVGHSDISAAYKTLNESGNPTLVARAAPWKNNHGDTLPPDVRPGLLARVNQIIEERTDDMDRLCNIREIPADWPASPCVTHPGFYVDHGGVLEPITSYQAQVRSQQKSIKGDPNVADSISAIDRNTLKSYRCWPGTVPHSPISLAEFGPT